MGSEIQQPDEFGDLLEFSRQHLAEHGCGGYPYDKGPLLQVLAAALAPSRIVEVGTAVGYTSVCMAASARVALVDTIDSDPTHSKIAAQNFEQYGVGSRVTAHTGEADDVLKTLDSGAYDLAFFDGFAPNPSLLRALHTLLRKGGLLVCANLTQGEHGNRILSDPDQWLTHSFGETALAVKR